MDQKPVNPVQDLLDMADEAEAYMERTGQRPIRLPPPPRKEDHAEQ